MRCKGYRIPNGNPKLVAFEKIKAQKWGNPMGASNYLKEEVSNQLEKN